MFYFIAAGLIGLGIYSYQNKNKILYKVLSVYSDFEAKKTNESKDKSDFNEELKQLNLICEDGILLESQQLPENYTNNYIIKLLYKNNINYIFNDYSYLLESDLDKLLDDNKSSPIIACTMNLRHNNSDVLKEYDITMLFNRFMINNTKFTLNNSSMLIQLVLDNYKIKHNINFKNFNEENIETQYIIVDKTVNIIKSRDMDISFKNNDIIIKKNID